MSDVVVFPVGKETEANAYLAWCNLNCPIEGDWYPSDRVDTFGQRVVGYLGPTGFIWDGLPYPEPTGGEEARAAGVLSATVVWPDEDE